MFKKSSWNDFKDLKENYMTAQKNCRRSHSTTRSAADVGNVNDLVLSQK